MLLGESLLNEQGHGNPSSAPSTSQSTKEHVCLPARPVCSHINGQEMQPFCRLNATIVGMATEGILWPACRSPNEEAECLNAATQNLR